MRFSRPQPGTTWSSSPSSPGAGAGRRLAVGVLSGLAVAAVAAGSGWLGTDRWGIAPEAAALAAAHRTAVATPVHAGRFVSTAEFTAAVSGAGRVAEAIRRSGGSGDGAAGGSSEAPGAASGGGPETDPAGGPESVVAAVVPHHLVAGHLAAGLFAYLASDPPDTLVIVGPDHYGRGPAVGTDYASWRTTLGDAACDSELVAGLLEAGLAEAAWAALDGEHSVGALMPLVRRYLPATRIVALTLSQRLSLDRAENLGRFLRKWAAEGRRTFVVASVDFSHYLTWAEAEAMDAATLSLMRKGDWPALFELGPAHLDSPASLAVAFAFAGTLDGTRFATVEHTNSASLLGQPNLTETTSHFLLTIYGDPDQ